MLSIINEANMLTCGLVHKFWLRLSPCVWADIHETIYGLQLDRYAIVSVATASARHYDNDKIIKHQGVYIACFIVAIASMRWLRQNDARQKHERPPASVAIEGRTFQSWWRLLTKRYSPTTITLRCTSTADFDVLVTDECVTRSRSVPRYD